MHPMKRLGKAEEIAYGFIFLASSQSSFVPPLILKLTAAIYQDR